MNFTSLLIEHKFLTTLNAELPFNATKTPMVVDTSQAGTESGCESGQASSHLRSKLSRSSYSSKQKGF